jgi:hypothetical protein
MKSEKLSISCQEKLDVPTIAITNRRKFLPKPLCNCLIQATPSAWSYVNFCTEPSHTNKSMRLGLIFNFQPCVLRDKCLQGRAPRESKFPYRAVDIFRLFLDYSLPRNFDFKL